MRGKGRAFNFSRMYSEIQPNKLTNHTMHADWTVGLGLGIYKAYMSSLKAE